MYALVTGATSGIGHELAKILAKDKYNLIIVGRRNDRLRTIQDEITKLYGVEVVAYRCDLGDVIQVKELIDFSRRYTDIEVVVNSAGFGKMGYIHEIDEQDDIDMINTNVTALHLINKHFATILKKGNIINISSIAGIAPTPYMSQYGATKAFVYSLSRSLDFEMKKLKKDVRILVACPGPVDTEFHDRANSTFKLRSISAHKCAQIIYKAMKKKKSAVMVGIQTKLAYMALRIAPTALTLPIEYKIQSKKNQ